MTYIDGFLCPVKPGRKEDYVAMAQMAAPLFIEYGALRVVETWNDDVKAGKVNDLRTAVIAEEGEDVVFSWIEWPDKATRDAGQSAIGAEMVSEKMEFPMPFDGKRVIYGGFTVVSRKG